VCVCVNVLRDDQAHISRQTSPGEAARAAPDAKFDWCRLDDATDRRAARG